VEYRVSAASTASRTPTTGARTANAQARS
jgi:hypothetical protein